MFVLLGRIAQHGLWLIQKRQSQESQRLPDQVKETGVLISNTANCIIEIFNNNPILLTPIMDNQAIELDATFHFLRAAGYIEKVKTLVAIISSRIEYAFCSHSYYPCIFTDYSDLAKHPERTEKYRKEATVGTVLIPILAIWAAIAGDAETLSRIKYFTDKHYSHSTLQLWFPGDDSEHFLYMGNETHGLCMSDFEILEKPDDMLDLVKRESNATTFYNDLSAIKFGMWPVVTLAALHHHRVPIPPQLWNIK